jgi:signal transduction histidine kinase/DNA-binding response OmpR family regulator
MRRRQQPFLYYLCSLLVAGMGCFPVCTDAQKAGQYQLPDSGFLDSLKQEARSARASRDSQRLANELLELSLHYSYNDQHIDSVLKWQREAQLLFRTFRDTAGLIRTGNALQHTFIVLDRQDDFERQLMETLQLSRESSDTLQQIINHLAVGNLYWDRQSQGALDSARQNFEKAIALSRDSRDTLHQMISHLELSAILLERNADLAYAKKHLDTAAYLRPFSGEPESFRPVITFTYGDYYRMTGRCRQAVEYYDQAIREARRFDDLILQETSYDHLASCYNSLGQFQLAFETLRKQQKLQQQIMNQERIQAIERIETEFEVQRKNDQIALLEKEQELRQQRLVRQRQWTVGIIVIATIALINAGLLLLLFRQRSKASNVQAQHERELKQQLKDFYTNITHEFRTPITVIQGSARNLPDQWTEKERILRNSEGLLDLVNQLLDLSKADAGTARLDLIQDDVVPFLDQILQPFIYLANGQDIHFSWSTGPYESLTVDFDPVKWQQIVVNLLTNALKFSDTGDTVTLTLLADEETWGVSVRDTGRGISKSIQNRIFDRFYQGANSRKFAGAGIGLAMVREWTDLMRGQISLESTPGAGTCIEVRVPVQRKAPAGSFQEHLGTSLAPLTRDGLSGTFPVTRIENPPLVLVIEDNTDLQELLHQWLSKSYRVITRTTGESGLKTAMQGIPDLILCDIVLPGKDGLEVIETLKDDHRTNHIPVILLTAKATQSDKVLGLSLGADAYLYKPFDPDELEVRIDNLIRQRQSLREKWVKHPDQPSGNLLPQEKWLHRFTEYIETHLDDESLNVEALGREFGLSRMQLHRKVKAMTGYSVGQFVQEIRLRKAKDLLLHTESQIAEIAYGVGFKDPNYFSKQFKAMVGVSPSAFRLGQMPGR